MWSVNRNALTSQAAVSTYLVAAHHKVEASLDLQNYNLANNVAVPGVQK